MGVSTDGILVFGFDLGLEDEKPSFLGEYDDLDDLLIAEAGLANTYDWPARRAAEAACPADLVMHCSHEYPMYILAVRGTAITANRGTPLPIENHLATLTPERIAAFKKWCEDRAIEYQEPQWLLCSMWG